MFCKKDVLRNLAKFTGKHLCPRLRFFCHLIKISFCPCCPLIFFIKYTSLACCSMYSLFKWTEAVAQRCSVKKMLVETSKNSQKSTCARVSFLIICLRPVTLLKYRLCERCFPVNFAKFLKTPFLTEHLRWLLL